MVVVMADSCTCSSHLRNQAVNEMNESEHLDLYSACTVRLFSFMVPVKTLLAA